MTSLSAREVLGSIPRSVKSGAASPTPRNVMFVRSGVTRFILQGGGAIRG